MVLCQTCGAVSRVPGKPLLQWTNLAEVILTPFPAWAATESRGSRALPRSRHPTTLLPGAQAQQPHGARSSCFVFPPGPRSCTLVYKKGISEGIAAEQRERNMRKRGNGMESGIRALLWESQRARRWIETEKAKQRGKAREQCDRQLHQARWQAAAGSVPSRGSWVQLQEGRRGERYSTSAVNLSIPSLDKPLCTCSPLSLIIFSINTRPTLTGACPYPVGLDPFQQTETDACQQT